MKPPNMVLLITDQQRAPRHWPDEPGWLAELMPNDAELARTGLTFTNAFCATAMCSPSRATLFTGRYPADHGVELTLTAADLRPDPRNTPAVAATMADILRRSQAPAGRVLQQFARGALRLGPKTGDEPVLPVGMANLAKLLRGARLPRRLQGQVAPLAPVRRRGLAARRLDRRDAEMIDRDYGFTEWEAPDAGENAKAEHFGGGNAGAGEGWDEIYTRQAERWLAQGELPEPFCLVVSLVNPHDVLGYPASYLAGGYAPGEFRDLDVGLPPTIEEDLSTKPAVHSLMRLGMAAYLGPLRNRQAQLDYVNFYAHLHRVVDAKVGRLLTALGSADDPGSLRSRTVVVRCADHGEMGLSHGGLRQKCFNVYEETINVPLVVSNPVLFPQARATGRARVAGGRAADDAPPRRRRGAGGARRARPDADPRRQRRARARGRGARRGRPEPGRRARGARAIGAGLDPLHLRRPPGRRPRCRTRPGSRTACARSARATPSTPTTSTRTARRASEYELYDLERDPTEVDNLVGVRTGTPASSTARALREELAERLDQAMAESGTTPVTTSSG